MPGLEPGISGNPLPAYGEAADGRVKPGHDDTTEGAPFRCV